MHRKAQITLFIIVAIVMMGAFGYGFYYLIHSDKAESSGTSYLAERLSLDAGRDLLQTVVQGCLEQTTREGLDFYGMKYDSQRLISSYISSQMVDCVDYSYFKNRGISVDGREPTPDVKISDESVIVNLDYPLIIRSESDSANLENFEYNIKREKAGSLKIDSNTGLTLSETRISTENDNGELIVPAGVKATDSSGNVLDSLSLKMLDKNFDGLSNSVVVGMVVYEGKPDGAQFSEPITIQIKYDPNDVPSGADEANMRIMWYDKTNDIWRSIPSEVDTVNNIVSAKVSHFTTFAQGVLCKEYEKDGEKAKYKTTYTFTKEIYRQYCGDKPSCIDADWEALGGGYHEVEPKETPKIKSQGVAPEGEGAVECRSEPKGWDPDDKDDDSCTEPAPPYSAPFLEKNGITNCKLTDTDCISTATKCIYSGETATAMTYGYEGLAAAPPGGRGYITFNVAGNGDSCVANEAEDKLKIDIQEKELSDGDTLVGFDNVGKGKYSSFSVNDDNQVRSGDNKIYFTVQNTNDGCIWATVSVTLTGFGITSTEAQDDCPTIQDRINYLTGSCGTDGSGWYGDSGAELNYLAVGRDKGKFSGSDLVCDSKVTEYMKNIGVTGGLPSIAAYSGGRGGRCDCRDKDGNIITLVEARNSGRTCTPICPEDTLGSEDNGCKCSSEDTDPYVPGKNDNKVCSTNKMEKCCCPSANSAPGECKKVTGGECPASLSTPGGAKCEGDATQECDGLYPCMTVGECNTKEGEHAGVTNEACNKKGNVCCRLPTKDTKEICDGLYPCVTRDECKSGGGEHASSDNKDCNNNGNVCCRFPAKCTPGCSDNSVTSCDAQGNRHTEACKEGIDAKCLSLFGDTWCQVYAICGYGTYCKNNILYICQGVTEIKEPCKLGFVCDKDGNDCVPDGTSNKCDGEWSDCRNNILYACRDGKIIQNPCPLGTSCSNNICSGMNLCSGNTCKNNMFVSCHIGLKDMKPCPDGTTCDDRKLNCVDDSGKVNNP